MRKFVNKSSRDCHASLAMTSCDGSRDCHASLAFDIMIEDVRI